MNYQCYEEVLITTLKSPMTTDVMTKTILKRVIKMTSVIKKAQVLFALTVHSVRAASSLDLSWQY
jgi:hypothetical protein